MPSSLSINFLPLSAHLPAVTGCGDLRDVATIPLFLNRKGAKDAKGYIYFLIGVADKEKNHRKGQ